MYISICEGENDVILYIYDNYNEDEYKPYYKSAQSYATFLCDYYNFGISKETDEYILDYLNLPQNKIDEMKKLLYVSQEKEEIFRKVFKYALSNDYELLSDYNVAQRFAALSTIDNSINIVCTPEVSMYGCISDTLDVEVKTLICKNTTIEDNMLNLLNSNGKTFFYDVTLTFNNLWDFICFCIHKIIINNTNIKKCSNCGKYFFPQSRSDEIYCDYVFKNNKSCKDLGYSIKIDNSVILKEYRKVYKTKNAWKNRNKYIDGVESDFKKWHIEAKTKLKQAQNEEISEQDFLCWLNENR